MSLEYNSPYTSDRQNAYDEGMESLFTPAEQIETFNLQVPDERLQKILINELVKDSDYWKQSPWRLDEVDIKNVHYLLGDQTSGPGRLKDNNNSDNRLFQATRAILSYATGQLATPEITPSRSDDQYLKMARNIQSALYQHSLDEKVDEKTRAAVLNLVVRKRGYMKLRFDPNAGVLGDVVTEVVNPEDITIDRFAMFMKNPNKIYQRLHMTIDEACSRWPQKKDEIYKAFGIVQGRYTQVSKMIHPYECWFTYLDDKGVPREGVAWFLEEDSIILDKIPNPNWIYTGNDMEDKQTNVMTAPPKPYVYFNYLNLGHAFVDETCLFEQAKPIQDRLNARNRQWNTNIDLMNGRWIFNKNSFSEGDANKFVNKGARSIALVDSDDVGKAAQVLTPSQLPPQVYESIQDDRGEIDAMMGTPSVFKGSQPQSQDTLGRDLLVKQQAGMLQDDLVRAVQNGMELYYQIKLQMWRVYYTEDYWFQTKGGDGKFDFIMLNGDLIDSNVKIGVQVDSTLPLDKAMVRQTSIMLAKMNRIDQLSLLEDLGTPNPEVRTERLLRSQLDPLTYMQSIEQGMDNSDAEIDIQMVAAGKEPEERDNYDQGYLDYYNNFLTTNRFAKLPDDVKQALVAFLTIVQHKAMQSSNLQNSMLNDAGIIDRPPLPPAPKRTVAVRLDGTLDPEQSSALSGAPQQTVQGGMQSIQGAGVPPAIH